jgi:hypothetical protein
MCGGNNPLESIANVGLNIATGGLVGLDDGKISGGVIGEPILKAGENAVNAVGKGLKDITGATAAEEANKLDREMFEQAKMEATKERENAAALKAQNDLVKSNLANTESNVNTNNSSVKNSFFSRYGLGNEGIQRDFLGL